VGSKCTQYSKNWEVLVLQNPRFEPIMVPDGKGVIAASRGSSVYYEEVVLEPLTGRPAIYKASVELDKKLVCTYSGRWRCVHCLPSAVCRASSYNRDAAGVRLLGWVAGLSHAAHCINLWICNI
jgi:hypothetical protein